MLYFGQDRKLSPRFIGPFEILELRGEVVYHLTLPLQLANVNNMFHILMLRKYEPGNSYVLDWSKLTLEQNASYVEQPTQILEANEHVLRGRTTSLVRVLWKRHGSKETT